MYRWNPSVQLVHDALVTMQMPQQTVVDDVFNRILHANTGMDVGGEEGEGRGEGDRKRPRELEEDTQGMVTKSFMALTHITNILTRDGELKDLDSQEQRVSQFDPFGGGFGGGGGIRSDVAGEERDRLLTSRRESMTALQQLVGYAADPPFDLAAAVKAKKDAFLREREEEGKRVLQKREEQAQQDRVGHLSRGGAQSQQGLSANSVPR